MELKAEESNKNISCQKLYISKKTVKPIKMEIEDINKKVLVYILYADLSPVVGSEQGGVRPVLIIQNDMGNKYSPTVIAAAITSQTGKNRLPTHIELGGEACGLKADSVVLAEQIRTIDKSRLKEKIGHIDDNKIIDKINNALGVSFGLEE